MNDWPTRAEIVAEAHTDVVNDTERDCVHEWRLIEERPAQSTPAHPKGTWQGPMALRWYCVHCRTVEETTA